MITKKDFIDYVTRSINKETTKVNYVKNGSRYIFEINSVTYKLSSDSHNINLNISNKNDFYSGYFEDILLSREEAMPMLEKLFEIVSNDVKLNYEVNHYGTDIYFEKIEKIHQYIKSINNYESTLNSNEKGQKLFLERFRNFLTIPIDGVNHKCYVGRVLNVEEENIKTACFITSIIKLPIKFSLQKEKDDYFDYVDHTIFIPGWKLEEYPILKEFTYNKVIGKKEEDMNDILNHLHDGKYILTNILEHTLDKKESGSKKNKI